MLIKSPLDTQWWTTCMAVGPWDYITQTQVGALMGYDVYIGEVTNDVFLISIFNQKLLYVMTDLTWKLLYKSNQCKM